LVLERLKSHKICFELFGPEESGILSEFRGLRLRLILHSMLIGECDQESEVEGCKVVAVGVGRGCCVGGGTDTLCRRRLSTWLAIIGVLNRRGWNWKV
jgi:hypothetical protein